MATYKIHPGVGIARLGNSDTDFYIAPETPAGLPQACEANGNPRYGADGLTPMLVTTFRDAEGRIKRQAARFQVALVASLPFSCRVVRVSTPFDATL